jgi:hypothetical protein
MWTLEGQNDISKKKKIKISCLARAELLKKARRRLILELRELIRSIKITILRSLNSLNYFFTNENFFIKLNIN